MYDPVTRTFIKLPEEYKIRTDLIQPAANAAAASIDLYYSRQIIIDKHNNKFQELRSDRRSIISNRCGISLNKKLMNSE